VSSSGESGLNETGSKKVMTCGENLTVFGNV